MFIVMESSAKMPSIVKAPYRKVAVVEIDQHATALQIRPAMISDRARGVVRVVRHWIAPANGKTLRSGIMQARAEALRICNEANNAGDTATAEEIIGAGGSA